MTDAIVSKPLGSAALDDLHARYRRPLLQYFMRRVGSVADAEDLTQEVFFRLLRRRERDRIQHDSGFLFTAATNLLRDRARRGQTIVSLLEGRVKVISAARGGEATPVDLIQGQQFATGADGSRVGRFDLEAVTAWETGRVVLSDVPLDEAVRRVNRYSDVPILVADPGLHRLKVSGVFNAGDARAFAEAVAALLPVIAEFRSDGAIALLPRCSKRSATLLTRTSASAGCA